MKLIEITDDFSIELLSGSLDITISAISIDISEVCPGTLFIARQNFYGNTHLRLEEAIMKGASALLISEKPDNLPHLISKYPDISFLYCATEDPTLAHLSARFYGHPTEKLLVLGVTGTNGKTTTVQLIHALLNGIGVPAAMMNTIFTECSGIECKSTNTTPDAIYVQRFAAECVKNKIKALVLEVSSHALAIGRVADVCFRHVGFTQLSREHLDFHGDMASYAAAKARLFSEALIPAQRCHLRTSASIFIDREWGVYMSEHSTADITVPVSTHQQPPQGLYLRRLKGQDLSGQLVRLFWKGKTLDFILPLVGEYNIENAAVAVSCVLQACPEIEPERLKPLLESFHAPTGRMQLVYREAFPRGLFIDYAHTPDALETSLCTLRDMHLGPVTVVFGAGGNRDKAKRPLMGAVAQKFADAIILTNDNPRQEDPDSIIKAIAEGFTDPLPLFECIPDRTAAIARALHFLDAGPVLIAGKGHETTQQFSDRTVHFSDFEAAAQALGLTGSPQITFSGRKR